MNLDVVVMRDCHQDDAYALHAASHVNPWQKASFVDCLTPPYFALALEDNLKLIGYALVLMVLDEATLMDIAIIPERRGAGAGHLLLEKAISECRRRGAQTLWLEVRVSNNAAIALYERHSFEVIERRKGYYPSPSGREDALIMRRILAHQ